MVKDFTAGKMLEAPGWTEELRKLSETRDVEPWLSQAIKQKAVSLDHSAFTDFKRKRLKFNKRIYDNWESLRHADIPNYKSAECITEAMLASWTSAGIIRAAREDEIPYITINPLHTVNTGKVEQESGRKPRFILHTKFNAVAKRQPTRLEGVGTSLHRILRMKSGVVLDARKAFYQIKISEASQRLCGFKIHGKVFVALVLTFGSSMGTHICNALLAVPIYGTLSFT